MTSRTQAFAQYLQNAQAGASSSQSHVNTPINNANNSRRAKKRSQGVISKGLPTSFQDKNTDLLCPICFGTIEEAYMTKCGHSFCLHCIKQSLFVHNRCPKCNFIVEKKDDIFPNFSLNEIIQKKLEKIKTDKRLKVDSFQMQNSTADTSNDYASTDDSTIVDTSSSYAGGRSVTGSENVARLLDDNLDLAQVNSLLVVLQRRRDELEKRESSHELALFKEFLHELKKRKETQFAQLNRELAHISEDLATVQNSPKNMTMLESIDNSVTFKDYNNGDESNYSGGESGFNGSKNLLCDGSSLSMVKRRKQLSLYFDEIEQTYMAVKAERTENEEKSLQQFRRSLYQFTRFSSSRCLATLNYSSDVLNNSGIISSLEFDKDYDYFAIAGSTRKIKIFEYNSLISDQVDIHYPLNEMMSSSKINTLVWNMYYKSELASGDSEGTVTLWDSFTGDKIRLFQEHERRCWSVDFSRLDPKLLVSGSDDSKVKLWQTNVDHSVVSLELNAPICSVKFNPNNRQYFALGCADHCVYYYDIRNTHKPLAEFKGHRKAVSYVRFLNSSEVVSASIDSQLKLWNVNTSQCVRTYKGHTNERNFVGMSTNTDYIACGSENNSLFVYHKDFTKHVISFKFNTIRSILDREKNDEEGSEFVSSVCWKPDTNVVLAGNSQGIVKVLELV